MYQLQSATKSLISTLSSCAFQQGFVQCEADFIADYFPDYPLAELGKSNVRISDLLTQRHDLAWKEDAWEEPDNTFA